MANPSSKNVTVPSLPQLQTTLASLTTASHIFQGFAHRNKNQHRGTRWWGSFDMLRRSIRKLLPDLEGAVQRVEVMSSAAAPAKRRKTDKAGTSVGVKQPELDKFVERAQWVYSVVGTNAYEAFTQLTAEKQFAQLGLVLIGVLAQVEAAIAPFVQQDATEIEDERERGSAQDTIKNKAVSKELALPAGLNVDDYDLGVAVSRDELGNEDDIKLSIEQESSPMIKHRSLQKREKTEKSKATGREKIKVDVGSSKSKEIQPVGSKHTDKVIKEKKKKKKKKGGDEFDDLFSSLV